MSLPAAEALIAAARAALVGTPRLAPADIFVHGTKLLTLADGDIRIAIAGSVTTDMIARAVAVGAVQEGLAPVIHQSQFGAWRQEALDPASSLHKFGPDIVLLVTTWRDVVANLPLDATVAEVDDVIDASVSSYRQVWDALCAGAASRRIIQHLPAPPVARLAGVAELRVPASPRRQVAAFRTAILEAGPDIVFLDTEDLVQDASAWFAARMPFALNNLPEYAISFRAALRSSAGLAKKALVLDLDNTLWGGVIGDSGLEDLVLGPDTPRGEAFAAFQTHVKALAARGIVLAVCSKNDLTNAEAGFTHPHTLLTRSNFAAFECSWGDKVAGLRRIAQVLNLGLDAMVFADDNPAECALVRAELPEVTVVELGDDPAHFVARLEDGNWFAGQSLNSDDLTRGQSYQLRARVKLAQEGVVDIDGFLQSLAMRGKVFRADGSALARVAQLEGKTNQFNLTTRRYSEAAIRDFAARTDAVLLAATLADKFGDHGLVSSLIGVIDGDALSIESWLMSCRVFSRTLEQFMMRALIDRARDLGLTKIVGHYVPTAKNTVVADLFMRLGFTPSVAGRWERPVSSSTDDLVTFVIDVGIA